MKLNEIKKQHKFLTDPDEIKLWLIDMEIENFTIKNDGTVDVNDRVYLPGKSLTHIPVKFGKVSANFDCSHNELVSLEGSPLEVGRNFFCNDNELTSFEGAPSKIGRYFYCYNNDKLMSMVGISDIITQIGGAFYADWNKIKSGGLGLILINGCNKLDGMNNNNSAFTRIIEKYLGRPDKIFECQQELIEAGFEEYAQL